MSGLHLAALQRKRADQPGELSILLVGVPQIQGSLNKNADPAEIRFQLVYLFGVLVRVADLLQAPTVFRYDIDVGIDGQRFERCYHRERFRAGWARLVAIVLL